MNTWLRANRRYLLAVEGVVLALFAFDLVVRLGNPDLWHPYYGGEKPMVLSFFDAVLKSTSFPPYNPWLAGYYLNYYYYGFVIVSIPVKLLGILPSFAYNLILPTLFSMVGVNAFGVAYNLVAAARGREAGPKLDAGSWKADGDGQGPDTAQPGQSLGNADPALAVGGVDTGEVSPESAASLPDNPLLAAVDGAEAAGNGHAAPEAEMAAPTSGDGTNGASEPASRLPPPRCRLRLRRLQRLVPPTTVPTPTSPALPRRYWWWCLAISARSTPSSMASKRLPIGRRWQARPWATATSARR
jgi:hypothetical protein